MLFRSRGIPVLAVSAAAGEGLPALLEAIWREVAAARVRTSAMDADAGTPIIAE